MRILRGRSRRSRDGGLPRVSENSTGGPDSPDRVNVVRPYTAESVVAKRGLMKIEFASNQQAKKLFALLEEHAKVSCESETCN